MTGLSIVFLVLGTVCSSVGAVLTGWNDLAPLVLGLNRRARRVLALLRSALGRSHDVTIHAGSGRITATGGGSASGIVSVAEDAPIERQVAHLLRQDFEQQTRLNELERQMADVDAKIKASAIGVESRLRAHMRSELALFRDASIQRRRVGIVLVIAGTVLLFLAAVTA